MRGLLIAGMAVAFVGLAAGAQPAPWKMGSATKLEGSIVKVLLNEEGQPPSLLVQPAGKGPQWTIRLGSFRYLMSQDFNPKAGQTVSVQGYTQPAEPLELVASSVTIVETGKTLQLRDAEGFPLWRRGGAGGGVRPPAAARRQQP